LEIARIKLAAMNISIDSPTPEMIEYANSWQMGT
jgi:S-adenosylhomocysteine hydrolase